MKTRFDLTTAHENSAREQAAEAAKGVAEHLAAFRDEIDRTFGKGYAKKHPELLAACMSNAGLETLAESLDHVASNGILEDHGNHIQDGLGEIAKAIESLSAVKTGG